MSEPSGEFNEVLQGVVEAAYNKGYEEGREESTLDSDIHLRLEAVRLAVQVKAPTVNGDTSKVIRSAHGIYDFIKTGNRQNNANEVGVVD